MPFAAIAGFMVVASVAYACTTFKGTFTVTPGGTNSSGSVTATGNCSGMGYSSGGAPSGGVGAATAKASTGTGTVSIATSAGGGCQLTAGTYDINYLNGPAFRNHTNRVLDCMSGLGGTSVNLGQVSVNSSGVASGTFNLPLSVGDVSPLESAVCISDTVAIEAHMVPVFII
ncbi:MAG: hypothetical protein ACR2MO_10565 [Acidimicrobiales bacterium]